MIAAEKNHEPTEAEIAEILDDEARRWEAEAAGREAERIAMLTRAWAPVDDEGDLGAAPVSSDDAGKLATAANASAPAPDTSATVEDPFAAEVARALVDVQAALGVKAPAQRPPLFIDACDLLAMPVAPTPWLIKSLLVRGGVAVLGAAPKACKTWVASDLALAIAVGGMALGEFRAEAGRVAYFYAEDARPQVRVGALMRGHGIRELPPGRLWLQPRRHGLNLGADEDLAWLLASCRARGALDLLVLDPLRDLHVEEENDSGAMSTIMRRLRVLGGLLGCAVLVTHHVAKPSQGGGPRRAGQRLRGSSAIGGALDAGIYLDRTGEDDPGRFDLVVDTELRDARAAGAFSLALTVEDDASGRAEVARWHLSWEVQRKAAGGDSGRVEAAVLENVVAQGPESASAIAKRLGGRKKGVLAACRDLLAAGRLVREDGVLTVPGEPDPRGGE